ncbi:MAG TPA: dephospho-CoA kinase, partial [Thermoanaerobaculia bacterium]|nr:dephospho-CoA kinase [Thermoanaerobaculia bacterium]
GGGEGWGGSPPEEGGAGPVPRLARLAFAEPATVARLNARIHPIVRVETERWLAERESEGHPVAVVEATLLVENNGRDRYDVLVAVSAPEELRLARALARDPGATRDAVPPRMRAQLPDAARNAACDEVIVTDGTLEELSTKAEAVAARLRSRASGRRA